MSRVMPTLLTPEELAFVKEIAARAGPPKGSVIRTDRGDVWVTQDEKCRLERIAQRENLHPTTLVNFHLSQ